MKNEFNFKFPSSEELKKNGRIRSDQEAKLINQYSDKQIWNNKPLVRVLKKLSKT